MIRIAVLVYVAAGVVFVGSHARLWWAEYDREAARQGLTSFGRRAMLLAFGALFDLILWPHSFCKLVVLNWWPRYCTWRVEREFAAAQRRMSGCTHERVQFVDVGAAHPQLVRQCLACWALELPGIPDSSWWPNCISPARHRRASSRRRSG